MMFNSEMKLVFTVASTETIFYVQLVNYPTGVVRSFQTEPNNNGLRWRMSEDEKWHGPCYDWSGSAAAWFVLKATSPTTYICDSNSANYFDATSGWSTNFAGTVWPASGFPDSSTTDAFISAKIYVRTKYGNNQFSIVSSSPTTGVFAVEKEAWPSNVAESQSVRLSLSTSTIDYESMGSNPAYALTIRATDGGDATSDTNVNINVLDVNEPPFFPSLRVLTIDENSASNVLLGGSLVAQDPDPVTSSTGQIMYDIIDGTGLLQFQLGASLPRKLADHLPFVYTTVLSIDYEKKSSYTLIARAYDGMKTCATVSFAENEVSGGGTMYTASSSSISSVDATTNNCLYWEVDYTTKRSTDRYPYVGLSSQNSENQASIYARLAPESSDDIGFIKPWAFTLGDPATSPTGYPSIKSLVVSSPANPIDGRVCAHWQVETTLSGPGYTLPSTPIIKSLNNIYRLTSAAGDSVFIYDPSPIWSGTNTKWRSNTVRKDGTSAVKCTTTTTSWSNALTSSSCLIKDGIVGSSNCDQGPPVGSDGWFLFSHGSTQSYGSGASGHPCQVPGTPDLIKLQTCVAVVDPAITKIPAKGHGIVLDYNHLHSGSCEGPPCYPPMFRIYSDNVLWYEELLPNLNAVNNNYYPTIKRESNAGWNTAKMRFINSDLWFTPRSSSQTDGSNSVQASYTVNVVNVNEKPNLANGVRYVNENSPDGTSATDVTGAGAALLAVDDDLKVCPGSSPDASGCTPNDCKSNCQKLTYSRVMLATSTCFRGTLGSTTDPCLNVFEIDPCTGLILVSNPIANEYLNFEVQNTYTLNVRVVDDGTYPASQEDTAVVTVNIKDVNEAPTVADKTVWVNENSVIGTSFGFVAAVDQDTTSDIHGQLSFSIDSGNTLGLFSVDKQFLTTSINSGFCSGSTDCWCHLRCPVTYPTRAATNICSDSIGNQCDLGYCKGPSTINVGMPTCSFQNPAPPTSLWGSGGAELKLATSSILDVRFLALFSFVLSV